MAFLVQLYPLLCTFCPTRYPVVPLGTSHHRTHCFYSLILLHLLLPDCDCTQAVVGVLFVPRAVPGTQGCPPKTFIT